MERVTRHKSEVSVKFIGVKVLKAEAHSNAGGSYWNDEQRSYGYRTNRRRKDFSILTTYNPPIAFFVKNNNPYLRQRPLRFDSSTNSITRRTDINLIQKDHERPSLDIFCSCRRTSILTTGPLALKRIRPHNSYSRSCQVIYRKASPVTLKIIVVCHRLSWQDGVWKSIWRFVIYFVKWRRRFDIWRKEDHTYV